MGLHSPPSRFYRSSHLLLTTYDIQKLVASLNQQQQEVLTLRFGLRDGNPMTLAKIVAVMNISRERVRQIERDALKQMRQRRGSIRAYLSAS